ncbi:transporter [Clostridiales bacterium PH28_bin88]|nr:transporter [Clostridiales bacterium PH28_bin88]
MKFDSKFIGLCYGTLAFTAWGFLPLYWKLLATIPAEEILAHRILWSFVFVSGILFYSGNWNNLKQVLKNRNNLLTIFLCSVFISINWFTYIWAINSRHVVEASMGYYINPLFVVFLGITVLKEKITFWQTIALIIAATGVVIITVQYGKVPWIALVLATSFGIYGLLKKVLKVDSVLGLALETAFITPAALAFILLKQMSGTGAIGVVSLSTTTLLMGSGVATATPLLWFARGAQRIELSSIGFLQYISPTISLLLGVFVFKEAFTRVHLFSFGFIWAALMVYSWSTFGRKKNARPEALASLR